MPDNGPIERWRVVPCRFCGAEAGQDCRRIADDRSAYPHDTRIIAAQMKERSDAR